MLNKRSRIIAIVVSAFFATLLCLAFFCSINPSLSKRDKEKVEELYVRIMERPLEWYDENGCIESDGVYRYVGTYGDIYAFLEIGDNIKPSGDKEDLPYPVRGLSRTVYYPVEAIVRLYHTKGALKNVYGEPTIEYITNIRYREDYLSDEMLEDLTQDIEEIAREHN